MVYGFFMFAKRIAHKGDPMLKRLVRTWRIVTNRKKSESNETISMIVGKPGGDVRSPERQ
jgi:hypothetical protein